MRQIDFEHGGIAQNILKAALPMLVAQVLNLLYNIVDRIYIARIPDIGTAALGAVGLCFPIIVIITAFSNLFGSGGAPLFAIARGSGDKARAGLILNLACTLLLCCAGVLMVIGLLFARPILVLFGASPEALQYALPYLMLYLLGTYPSMLTTGLNPFINAQGYATAGMLSVVIGAAANLVLDPVFIFVLGMGIRGAAAATVLSQLLSAAFVVYFLRCKSEYRVQPLPLRQLPANRRCIGDIVSLGTAGFIMHRNEAARCAGYAKSIVSLGTAAFIMQLTNSLVTICANSVLAVTGGDIYISVMTIISSVRQMVETPLYAITEGSSPIISYNYGARRPRKVLRAAVSMALMALVYTLTMLAPHFLISIFSSDPTLQADTIPSMKLYFSTFGFMLLQYVGQTVFKSLNKRRHAVFFSLLRKFIIVVPLTYLLPYAFGMGTDGVFAAEPVSNVIGGSLCFIVMLITVLPELKRMDREDAKTAK